MALEKLKECPQSLWLGTLGYSKGGICFYMSEYVQATTWASGTYDEAKASASASVPATIMKSGKAKNLTDRDKTKMFAEWRTYSSPVALDAMTIYRIALWFGAAAGAPATDADPLVGRNHAAVVATGRGGSALFFEPNFGFYEVIDAGANQKTLLETTIDALYGALGNVARNFIYLKGRKLKE